MTLSAEEAFQEAELRRTVGDAAIVALTAEIAAPIELDRVPAAFGDEAPNWLGMPLPGSANGHDYACDLELRVGPDRWCVFRKSAVVRIGQPVRMLRGWVVPIEWRAAGAAPLFPVFVGRLSIGADRLALDGHYAPPFGIVGYLLDRALLALAARLTAGWFLGKVEAVLRQPH